VTGTYHGSLEIKYSPFKTGFVCACVECMEWFQDVLPIVTQCLEGIQKCTDSINEKEVKIIYIHYSKY